MKKIILVVLSLILVLGMFPTVTFAEATSDDIIILYENDVHCAVEGYSKLAAMKNELKQTYKYVGVVSCGDYIQGSSLGAISRGEYIIELMNLVGYDAITLGNHEFDFRLDRLQELVDMMETKPVCCNFKEIGEDTSYFDPYKIVSYGDVDIAYIGITTPSTISSSSPAQFKDENGNYKYSFNPTTLYEVVQENIDAAEAEGADYIIAISHIGYAEDEIYGDLEDVEDLIKNTDGLDVVLDAHSHSVIEGMEITDKEGNEVLLSSTGTKFENIGKLTISNGEIKTELIKTEDYQGTDPIVDAKLNEINGEYATLGERKVAFSQVDLITHDADGNRLVRKQETALGNLCADAFRGVMGADIGYINGGNLRSPIEAGDVTFNNILDLLPFNNSVVVSEISGQTLKDMMEMAMKTWPEENGAFPHLSGMRFSVNTAIKSSVVLNDEEEFVSVSGQYRVYDIEIFNKETNEYEPLDLTKTYTIAATNYYLLEYGSGMTMLKDAKIIQNEGMLDVEALERYIVEALDGTIGEEYAEVKNNITFTEGIIEDPVDNNNQENNDQESQENNNQGENDQKQPKDTIYIVWIIVAVVGVSILIVAVIVIKKRR
ncbi:MAG: bifunctional UDP-sugar hydrolase/5'-nucleotidase [Clostridia bacterium]|nr:bifunctional UDP-sugar hydrolase/5'-nucleotidase [Clostridia bacterium]